MFNRIFKRININTSVLSKSYSNYSSNNRIRYFKSNRFRTIRSPYIKNGLLTHKTSSIIISNPKLNFDIQQKRHVVMSTGNILLITKVIALASVAYLLLQFVKFHPYTQKKYIHKKLSKPNVEIKQHKLKMFKRDVEIRFLQKWFRGLPTGPMLVVGPAGSGRSHMIRQALNGRKMVIYVDFLREPVVTGEEFMGTFIQNTGYQIQTPNEISRIFMREEQRKNKITAHEAEKALSVIFDYFVSLKESNQDYDIPIICLDNFHHQFQINGNIDPFWAKLMDWFMHVTDSKLAHVVLVPAIGFSYPHLFELPGFRSKRVTIYVDFPRIERIRAYIKEVCSTMEIEGVETYYERKQMIDWIANCVGGHMDDLMQTLYAIYKGERYGNVLRRLITDTVSFVEEKLESILSEADGAKDSKTKEEVYKRYLRAWKMMDILREKEYIKRRELVGLVFNEHTKELQQYLNWGLITYINQRPDIQGVDSASYDIEFHSSNENRIPSFWRIYDEQAEQVTETTEPPQETIVDENSEQVVTSLLNSSLESLLVCAASPRIRIAFDLLLKDNKLMKQREKVKLYLEKKDLQEKLEKMDIKKKKYYEDRKEIISEINMFATNAENIKSVFGEEYSEKKKKTLIERETHNEEKLSKIELETEEVERKIEELTS